MPVRGSFSGLGMPRLAATALKRSEATGNDELCALAEYHSHLSQREQAVLLSITRSIVAIERAEGAEAAERRLRQVCAVMGPVGNA